MDLYLSRNLKDNLFLMMVSQNSLDLNERLSC